MQGHGVGGVSADWLRLAGSGDLHSAAQNLQLAPLGGGAGGGIGGVPQLAGLHEPLKAQHSDIMSLLPPETVAALEAMRQRQAAQIGRWGAPLGSGASAPSVPAAAAPTFSLQRQQQQQQQQQQQLGPSAQVDASNQLLRGAEQAAGTAFGTPRVSPLAAAQAALDAAAKAASTFQSQRLCTAAPSLGASAIAAAAHGTLPLGVNNPFLFPGGISGVAATAPLQLAPLPPPPLRFHKSVRRPRSRAPPAGEALPAAGKAAVHDKSVERAADLAKQHVGHNARPAKHGHLPAPASRLGHGTSEAMAPPDTAAASRHGLSAAQAIAPPAAAGPAAAPAAHAAAAAQMPAPAPAAAGPAAAAPAGVRSPRRLHARKAVAPRRAGDSIMAGASSASPSSSGRSHATAVPPAAAAGRRATKVPSRYASMEAGVPKGFLQPHRPAAEGAAAQTAAAQPARPDAAPQTSGWQRLHEPASAALAAVPQSAALPPEPAVVGSADENSPRSVHDKPSDDEVVSPPDPAAPVRPGQPSQPPVPALQRLSAGCASSATPMPDERQPAPAASVAQPQQAAVAATEAAGTLPTAVVATSAAAAQPPAVRRSSSGRSEASNEVPPEPAGDPAPDAAAPRKRGRKRRRKQHAPAEAARQVRSRTAGQAADGATAPSPAQPGPAHTALQTLLLKRKRLSTDLAVALGLGAADYRTAHVRSRVGHGAAAGSMPGSAAATGTAADAGAAGAGADTAAASQPSSSGSDIDASGAAGAAPEDAAAATAGARHGGGRASTRAAAAAGPKAQRKKRRGRVGSSALSAARQAAANARWGRTKPSKGPGATAAAAPARQPASTASAGEPASKKRRLYADAKIAAAAAAAREPSLAKAASAGYHDLRPMTRVSSASPAEVPPLSAASREPPSRQQPGTGGSSAPVRATWPMDIGTKPRKVLPTMEVWEAAAAAPVLTSATRRKAFPGPAVMYPGMAMAAEAVDEAGPAAAAAVRAAQQQAVAAAQAGARALDARQQAAARETATGRRGGAAAAAAPTVKPWSALKLQQARAPAAQQPRNRQWRPPKPPAPPLESTPEPVIYKVCKDCNVSKPETDFYRERGCNDGRRSQCKACQNVVWESYPRKVCQRCRRRKRHHFFEADASQPDGLAERCKKCVVVAEVVPPDFKRCSCCTIVKPNTEFHKDKTRDCGLHSRCNACSDRRVDTIAALQHCTQCRAAKTPNAFPVTPRTAPPAPVCNACVVANEGLKGHSMPELRKKTCSSCNEEKWVCYFWVSRKRGGYTSRCIDCAKLARNASHPS